MPEIPFASFAEAEDLITRAVVAEVANLLRVLVDRLKKAGLSSSAMGDLVSLSDVAEAFAVDARRAGLQEAKAGRPPSGFKLRRLKGERVWTNRAAALDLMRRHRGARLIDIATPITPAQAEQRFGPRQYAKLAKYVGLKPDSVRLVSVSRK